MAHAGGAQELLNSNKSLVRIAQEIGYDTEASFTRAFKRSMGMPPVTWRRRQACQTNRL